MIPVRKINWLCSTWQGFLQQAVYLISRGYFFHLLMIYPEKKRDRFEDTDRKLIAKYRCDLSKFQRSRRKLKGLANFYFMRWDCTACIFMSPGGIPEGVRPDEGFRDSREKSGRFRFRVNTVVFEIAGPDRNFKAWTARLDKETFRNLKAGLQDVCMTGSKDLIVRQFRLLNGFPAWAGIIAQKTELKKFTLHQARKHQVRLSEADLPVFTGRSPVKVWDRNLPLTTATCCYKQEQTCPALYVRPGHRAGTEWTGRRARRSVHVKCKKKIRPEII